jgi:hypothetical protein
VLNGPEEKRSLNIGSYKAYAALVDGTFEETTLAILEEN